MERSSGVLQGGRDEGILDFDKCRHYAGLTNQPTSRVPYAILYGTTNLLWRTFPIIGLKL